MASRAEQKAAARAAREAQQRQLSAAAARRQRLMVLGGALAAALIALAVVIIVSTKGGGSGSTKVSKSEQAAALAVVDATLAGIPQHGNVLGNPKAPITITEFGDLVCSTCAAFAQSTEPQIIAALVKTGQAKLAYRALESASAKANKNEFVNTQVAARSAGLQGKEWNYVLLTYEEQPATINGTPAELVSYVNTAYLQSRAAQIKGLNLAQWQAHLTDRSLTNAVNADENSALAANASGTPAVFVSGPKGTAYDSTEGVPTLATIQALVNQVS